MPKIIDYDINMVVQYWKKNHVHLQPNENLREHYRRRDRKNIRPWNKGKVVRNKVASPARQKYESSQNRDNVDDL